MSEIEIEITEVELSPEDVAMREAYEAGEYEREVKRIEILRHAAYSDRETGSDILLIKAQLGEDDVTLEDVKARKAEIRAQYPMPEKPGK